MAEVLICAEDRNVPDTPMKWRKGDPVVVMPDGHNWGKREGLPRFVVVRVNAPIEEVRAIADEVAHDLPVNAGRRMYPMNDSMVDMAKDAMLVGSIREYANLNQFRAHLNRRDEV